MLHNTYANMSVLRNIWSTTCTILWVPLEESYWGQAISMTIISDTSHLGCVMSRVLLLTWARTKKYTWGCEVGTHGREESCWDTALRARSAAVKSESLSSWLNFVKSLWIKMWILCSYQEDRINIQINVFFKVI